MRSYYRPENSRPPTKLCCLSSFASAAIPKPVSPEEEYRDRKRRLAEAAPKGPKPKPPFKRFSAILHDGRAVTFVSSTEIKTGDGIKIGRMKYVVEYARPAKSDQLSMGDILLK